MKRLNGMDAYLLFSETPNLHSHTLKVAVIDAAGSNGQFDFVARLTGLPIYEALAEMLVAGAADNPPPLIREVS